MTSFKRDVEINPEQAQDFAGTDYIVATLYFLYEFPVQVAYFAPRARFARDPAAPCGLIEAWFSTHSASDGENGARFIIRTRAALNVMLEQVIDCANVEHNLVVRQEPRPADVGTMQSVNAPGAGSTHLQYAAESNDVDGLALSWEDWLAQKTFPSKDGYLCIPIPKGSQTVPWRRCKEASTKSLWHVSGRVCVASSSFFLFLAASIARV